MAETFEFITDQELADLPEDDEQAFVLFERTIRDRYLRISGKDSTDDAERAYVKHILSFVKQTGIELHINLAPPNDIEGFYVWFDAFFRDIDDCVLDLRVAHARKNKTNFTTSIYLSYDCREEIDKLLARVRKVVNQADFPEAKKDAIYQRIAALQAEVDKSRTRLDAFLSRWLDVTNAVGEGAENLEPLAKLLERIMKVLGRAKAQQETGQLPTSEETKKLPSPEVDGNSDSLLGDESTPL